MKTRLIILGAAVLALSAAARGVAQQPADFTFALTGDSIITRKLTVYSEPAFTRIIDLVRNADVAFTNLEMLFHDYEPYASAASGGTYMRAEPALVKDLVWAGFDMVARANNHTGDYGVLGMDLTTRYVAEAGLVQAGVGHSLAEAREAKFLEHAKGRVALVSVASTFPDSSRAGKTRGDMPARPGLNPLRFETITTVTPQRIADLRQIQSEINGSGAPGGRGGGNAINFFGRRFVAGATPGVRTEPNTEDLTEIAAVVKNAAGLADYIIVTIHAHEGGRERTLPADFLVTFARAMVDAGADMFVGHGPHVLRGVEIYKGKPILYSLGDFIFQNETLLRLPSENYEGLDLGPGAHVNDFNDARYNFDKSGFPADRMIWEAVVAVPKFRSERLIELALHPITLGFGQSRAVRGRPMFAEGELGQKILGDLVKFSGEMGTKISIRNGIGYVDLPQAASSNQQATSLAPSVVPDRVVPLFNGRDLSGWKADVPAKDTNPAAPDSFIVRNGMLVSLGEPRGHLLTESAYRDYRLQVEYRFVGKGGNCGVLVHASRLRALSAMFPQSIEVQMQHEQAGDFWCIEENIEVPQMETRRPRKEGQKYGGSAGDARRILNLTDGSEKPLGEWNTMVIEARGRTLKVWVNGDLVNEGFASTADRGRIALQAEGTEVEFRRVEIGPLPPLAKQE